MGQVICMARVIAQLAAYNEACARRQQLLRKAASLAEAVKNGATVLEEDPSKWKFGNTAGPRTRSRRCMGADVAPIDPATWPSVGELVALQQEYMRASALESAALAVLPAAWKPPR